MWSVADGRHGRRWRESLIGAGILVRALLVETTTDGAIHRLEIGSAAGLLTLHPETSGGTLHGNVVRPAGIDHLRFDWGPDRAILIDDSPAMTAIAVAILGRGLAAGERRTMDVLRIDDRLVPAAARVEVGRLASGTIRWSGPDTTSDATDVVLDEAGLVPSSGRTIWPLER